MLPKNLGNPGPSEQCFYANASTPFYNSSNDPHAFPIGFGSDGYFTYAQYIDGDHGGLGDPEIDTCGGHSHTVDNNLDTNSYHYHSYTTVTSAGEYQFWSGPSKCWKGDVDTIPNFYEDSSVFKLNYDSSTDCSIKQRTDYQQLQACSDSSSKMYYPGRAVQPCNWFDVSSK